MREFNREDLERHAFRIRRRIIHTIATNGEGHAGGALSISDCMSVVAFAACSEERAPLLRDKIILSAGHKCLALYSMLENVETFLKMFFLPITIWEPLFPGTQTPLKFLKLIFRQGL